MKNLIRYLLSMLTVHLNLKEFSRSLYLSHGKHFVMKRKGLIQEAWARRSVVNSDFMPFLSDLDLTVLIDDAKISQIYFSRAFKTDMLIRDIQFLSPTFYSTWLRTGGLRNRQINNWKPLAGGEYLLRPPFEKNKAIIAFELAHEVYLLYRQLEPLLPRGAMGHLYDRHSAKKLCQELQRLKLYWEKSDETILSQARKEISISIKNTSELINFLNHQNEFWKELLSSLEYPLGNFPLQPLIKSEVATGKHLYLEFSSLPVFVTQDFQNLVNIKNGPPQFVCTETFLCLVKGVGVQDQEHFNKLARNKNTYYFGFNQQRLAHDLIDTLATAPDNASQLFFCFKNIKEFAEATETQIPSEWKEIEEWTPLKAFPFQGQKLVDLSLRHLELLRSMG